MTDRRQVLVRLPVNILDKVDTHVKVQGFKSRQAAMQYAVNQWLESTQQLRAVAQLDRRLGAVEQKLDDLPTAIDENMRKAMNYSLSETKERQENTRERLIEIERDSGEIVELLTALLSIQGVEITAVEGEVEALRERADNT